MSLFPDERRLPAPFMEPGQAQPRPPTDYENLVGDALEAAFRDGATELAQVIERLNADGIRTPQGGRWTVDNFELVLNALGR